MNKNQKIAMTNEILGAVVLGMMNDAEKELFISSPRNYILAKTNQDLGVDITTVSNQENEVNIALPYYEGIDAMKAHEVHNEDLNDVSAGGEIVMFVAGAAVATGILTTAVLASVAGISIDYNIKAPARKDRHGNNLDFIDYVQAKYIK